MKKRAVSVLLAAMMMSTGLCACAAQAQQSAPEQAAESANEAVEIETEGETEGAEDAAEAAPAETEQVENAQSAAEAGTPADAASGQGTGAGAELEAKERPKFTLEMHSFYDTEQVNDSYLTYANGSYATVKLSEETKAAYPSLDSALKAYSDDCAANAHKWLEEVVDAAKSYR